MNNVIKSLLFIVSLITCVQAAAQGLNGTWTGKYEWNIMLVNPTRVLLDLQIDSAGNVGGILHEYYKGSSYAHTSVTGTFNTTDSSIVIEEDSILSIRPPDWTETCPGRYSHKLKLKRSKTQLKFEGIWSAVDGYDGMECPALRVSFEKRIPSPDPALQRKEHIQAMYELSSAALNTIFITVKDNADPDGDIVTIYLNDAPVYKSIRLTGQEQRFALSADSKAAVNKILIVAESEGSVPPCTATAILQAGGQTHQLELKSSNSANAVIELFTK